MITYICFCISKKKGIIVKFYHRWKFLGHIRKAFYCFPSVNILPTTISLCPNTLAWWKVLLGYSCVVVLDVLWHSSSLQNVVLDWCKYSPAHIKTLVLVCKDFLHKLQPFIESSYTLVYVHSIDSYKCLTNVI